MHVRVQVARAQQGQAHGKLAAVAEQHLVATVGVVGGKANGRGAPRHRSNRSTHPSRRDDGFLDEFRANEREHDVQLGSGSEQRLGPQDVGAAGQGAVRVPRGVPLHDLVDAPRDGRLRLRPRTGVVRRPAMR